MPEMIDPQLVLLAESVVLSDDGFCAIYDILASLHDADSFMVLKALSGQDDNPFYAAFIEAKKGKWLGELCLQLTTVDGLKASNEPNAESLKVKLHKVIEPELGFLDASAMTRAGLEAVRRVCRVVVENSGRDISYGTGFLVGPQAILTAWHVIEPLLGDDGVPLEGSDKKIKIEFDHVGVVYEQLHVSVAPQWLVSSSAYHQSESPHQLSIDFVAQSSDGFDQYLDYAGIRLSTTVGRLRGFYKLDRLHKPQIRKPGSQMTLYQHPGGKQMRVAYGYGTALWPAEHQTRLRHTVNAMPGSSGGLLLDVNFKPVALHQCGIESNGELINGAIPTACIAARSAGVLEGVLGLDPVWRTDHRNEPILGRKGFQQAIQDCMVGTRQIIAVVGQKESGKSFSLEILRTVLKNNAEHSIVMFRAAELVRGPRAFAEEVIRRSGPRDSVYEPLPLAEDGDTAVDAWIKGILFPAFAKQVNAVTEVRQLWLVIDELDANPLAQGPLQHFLEQLYQEIADIPKLRVLLLGAKSFVPGARPDKLCVEVIQPVSQQDIIEYLQLYSIGKRLELTEGEVRRQARLIEKSASLLSMTTLKGLSYYIQHYVYPAMESA
ncbi:trypsin-like peptidase domain-containing protein [Pseudomonas putida]|uniref:trypsin-like serine peptidase n=1 Tax=Pseudomonas putida TaxID=303 RepID=UPI003524C828